MNCRSLLSTLIICSISLYSVAQKNPYQELTIASPNAMSLGKFGDIPVNYHTGIPAVDIPIYTVKEGPLELPVGLSYHASGLKVMEPASWVGAGWSLQAGGVITRTVQGSPDERGTGTVNLQTHGHFSDFGFNRYLWLGHEPGPIPIDSMMDWEAIMQGTKDGEPDLFFYNFAGFSGKFYFNDDGGVVHVPENDIKVEPLYTGTESIKSFKLTIADGTKYYFGRTESPNDVDPIEKTKTYSEVNGPVFGDVISSWYLNKIESADGLFSISLKYDTEQYSYFSIATFSSVAYDPGSVTEIGGMPATRTITTYQTTYYTLPNGQTVYLTMPIMVIPGSPYISTPVPLGVSSLREYSLSKNIIEGVRLRQIIFSNGKIDFLPGNTRLDLNSNSLNLLDEINEQAKSLSSIRISNNEETFCYSYNLSYSYFEDINSALTGLFSNYNIETDRKRLKLESIQQKSCDNIEVVPPYTFSYYDELVPRRLSFGQDHWGFINGNSNNTQLMPAYTVDRFNSVAGANREANWPAMRGGTLKKINYPTGGYTEFEFEPHTTWISSPTYAEIFGFSMSMGYDGGYTPIESYQTFTDNPYKIILINAPCPTGIQSCPATVNIYNSNDQLVETLSVPAGEDTWKVIQLPAGVYKITLFKDKGSFTGTVGCNVTFKEMEASSYQRNEIVGGLRIKKIKNHDGISDTNDEITELTYESNGQSTGVLFGRPTYVQVVRNDIYKEVKTWDAFAWCYPNGCPNCEPSKLGFVQNPGSLRPLNSTQGSHIGYKEIKEKKLGNGHIIHRFFTSNYWDFIHDDVAYRNVNLNVPCDLNSPNYPSAPSSFEPMRGELKYTGYFNEAGQLLKEVEYLPLYTENPIKTPAFIVVRNHPSGYLGTFYELKTAKKVQTTITERIYSPGVGNTFSEQTILNESPYHTQVTREYFTNSVGTQIETEYKYVNDFRIPDCEAISSCVQEYLSNLSTITGQYQNTYYNVCTDNNCRWLAWQDFIHSKSLARRAFVNCRRANLLNASSAFQLAHDNAKNNADAELKAILEMQDRHINLPVEETIKKNGELQDAGYTNFKIGSNSNNPIYPLNYQRIHLSALSSTFQPASVINNTILKDNRYFVDASMEFDQGNLVQFLGRNGIANSYIYGLSNTLPIVKAVGVDYLTLKNAFESVGGNLSQLRNHASLSEALVSTYEYSPLKGLTKETDPRGRTIFYEYDDLSRLVLVRDHEQNILKKVCYNFAGQPENCAINCTNTSANWQNTATLRCQENAGQNTGYQEQEQVDINPCSPTYNQTQWILAGYDPTACPLTVCSSANCSGDDKKCINGVCETGERINKSSTYYKGTWTCRYVYRWSDCSESAEFIETGPTACTISPLCY